MSHTTIQEEQAIHVETTLKMKLIHHNIHDPEYALFKLRSISNLHKDIIYRTIVQSHHVYCGLNRDNWQCEGEHYANILRHTPLFNAIYSMGNIKPGSSILLEGDSYLAQTFFAWVCESNWIQSKQSIKLINGELNKEIRLWRGDIYTTNNGYVQIADTSVQILLIDNDYKLQSNVSNLVHILTSNGFIFDTIILGTYPDPDPLRPSMNERISTMSSAWPDARVYGCNRIQLIGCDCLAEFKNCLNHTCGHQCSPGPMLRQIEALAAVVMDMPLPKKQYEPICPVLFVDDEPMVSAYL